MKYLSIIVFCFLFSACGSASGPSPNSKPAANAPGNSNAGPGVVSNGNSSPATSGTPDMTGISTVPRTDVSDANTGAGGPIAASERGRVLTEGPPPPPGSKPPSVGAGDDSTVSSEMLKDGSILERRVFANNEYLKALEIRTVGRDRSARVILKSGKSVKVPAARIGTIGSPSAALLMELAGIKPRSMPTQDQSKSSRSARAQ